MPPPMRNPAFVFARTPAHRRSTGRSSIPRYTFEERVRPRFGARGLVQSSLRTGTANTDHAERDQGLRAPRRRREPNRRPLRHVLHLRDDGDSALFVDLQDLLRPLSVDAGNGPVQHGRLLPARRRVLHAVQLPRAHGPALREVVAAYQGMGRHLHHRVPPRLPGAAALRRLLEYALRARVRRAQLLVLASLHGADKDHCLRWHLSSCCCRDSRCCSKTSRSSGARSCR